MGNQAHQRHGRDGGMPDLLFWGSASSLATLYSLAALVPIDQFPTRWLQDLTGAVFVLINTIWWGVAIGIVMIALLTKVPREFVVGALGRGGQLSGVVRATLAGVLLDLCSHGILLVGAKLYERGASAGQVVAFLVASPWNSFSLTLVLIALIGVKWTFAFIALSLVIAIVAGLAFDRLVGHGALPENPNRIDLPDDFRLWPAVRNEVSHARFSFSFLRDMLFDGVRESQMVLRWILFGVLLAALVKAFVDTENLKHFFGPTVDGLLLTILIATILEVCSEGSTPIAADLLTRAGAPGNSFAFLMTGVVVSCVDGSVCARVDLSGW